MRIVAWNIRAGGGVRAPRIVAHICRWKPDIVVASEFRGTQPSAQIAAQLRGNGWEHQRTTTDPNTPAVNSLLIASRWRLRVVKDTCAPNDRHRWLRVRIAAPQVFDLMAVHVPNRSSGRKYPFLQAVADIAERWRQRPAIIVGDTNSGRIGIDEQAPAFSKTEQSWIDALNAAGWVDGFRYCHPARREFTWYSPNGNNGFRLDQVFVHNSLIPGLRGVRHVWAGDESGRRAGVSDHAALLIDFQPP